MKLLVETTGSFGLMDIGVRPPQEIAHNRPSVVISTEFIQTRIAKNQLKILGKLQDEATDAEFINFHADSKGDTELAVSSFMSKFGIEEVTGKKKK